MVQAADIREGSIGTRDSALAYPSKRSKKLPGSQERIEKVRQALGNRCGVNQEPDFDIALLCRFREVRRRYKNVLKIGYHALRVKSSAFEAIRR
jgi:hypothetical protein